MLGKRTYGDEEHNSGVLAPRWSRIMDYLLTNKYLYLNVIAYFHLK